MSRMLKIWLFVGMSAGLGFGQTTESPSVVPVGYFWIESDVAAVTRNSSAFRQLDIAATLVTWGVAQNLDLQLEFAGWSEQKIRLPGGVEENDSGWGDLGVRAKWNFWGEEETGPAWAILGYTGIPTTNDLFSTGAWEPGIALIYGQPVPVGGWMEAMIAVSAPGDGSGSRDAVWFGSAVWGSDSGWYGEILIDYEPESGSGDLSTLIGVGYAREVIPGITLDAELLGGLNQSAPDMAGVIRITWEFGADDE